MEHRGREPKPRIDLEKSLKRVPEGHLLEFTATGYRLHRLLRTGETHLQAIRLGKTETIIKVPLWSSLPHKESTHLPDLLEAPESTIEAVDTPATLDPREVPKGIVTPADIHMAAIIELEKRETEESEKLRDCTNCEGMAQLETGCPCILGNLALGDIFGSAVSFGETSSNCNNCEGSGKQYMDCTSCDGCGRIATYPSIILLNEVSGEERTLKLDLAALIIQGEIEVTWDPLKRLSVQQYHETESALMFNVSRYIYKNVAEMGFTIENVAKVSPTGLSRLRPGQSDIGSKDAYWRKYRSRTADYFDQDEEISAVDILRKAQIDLSDLHANQPGRIKDSTGAGIAEKWVLRPLDPPETTLEKCKSTLAEYGYTLGFSEGFIAEGETGPAFLLLDSNGNAIFELSCEYDIRQSIENAWFTIQKLMKSSGYL
jgi:hypothetical protein